jgi:hypothetical protein
MRSFRLEDGGRVVSEGSKSVCEVPVEGPASAIGSSIGSPSWCAVASVGSLTDWGGDAGVGGDVGAGGTGGAGPPMALRFSFALRWADQRPCIDRLSAFEPCLSAVRL